MKNLYVGCRVRILHSTLWPEIAGSEGTIINTLTGLGIRPGRPGIACGPWVVSVDAWGGYKHLAYDGFGEFREYAFCPSSEQLEPVLPPDFDPRAEQEALDEEEELELVVVR